MGKLVVASKNKAKFKEIAYLLTELNVELISMHDAGFNGNIEETGNTFEENAILKAKTVHNATGLATIADDSGLEVEYLEGAPGVYSSRFAGDNADDEDRVKKLLEALKGVPPSKRNATFVCVVAAIDRNGQCLTVRGECKGLIAAEPAGQGGFGYDPVFIVPSFCCAMAQLSPEEKNKISHRGIAFRLMKQELKNTPGFII